MEKRIKLSHHRTKQGNKLHTAQIQVKLMKGIWITVTRIVDSRRWYVKSRAQEIMDYMENELNEA